MSSPSVIRWVGVVIVPPPTRRRHRMDNTGARDTSTSRALGPKRRLHHHLGPVIWIHLKT